jgi:hypothetical protein
MRFKIKVQFPTLPTTVVEDSFVQRFLHTTVISTTFTYLARSLSNATSMVAQATRPFSNYDVESMSSLLWQVRRAREEQQEEDVRNFWICMKSLKRCGERWERKIARPNFRR